ncbi:MAG: WD40/YVTN/BNR-like repeat-containing protein, partial [Flavobacteriales bacterium]
SGSGVNKQGDWETPYIMNPNNSSELLVGKEEVFRTTDGGQTFSQVGDLPSSSSVLELAMAPSNSDYIYASKGNNLYVSKDGNSFDPASNFTSNTISYISVDQSNPEKIWVTVSGFDQNQKVYYSTDAGSSFQNITGNLPNFPANTVVHQKGTNNGIYIGMDVG